MNDYAAMYQGLRAHGESEELAAWLVDIEMEAKHNPPARRHSQQRKERPIMAKFPGTNGSGNGRGNGNRANIVDGYELESTYSALRAAPADLAEAAGRVADLRHSLIEVKQVKLVDAKVAVDRAITGATMEAYGSGVITGKNQAERDLQVSAYLDKDKAIQEARESLRHWEIQLAGIEARLEMAEAEYKAAYAKLSAARSAAALQTTYLQVLTWQSEGEAETAEAYEREF